MVAKCREAVAPSGTTDDPAAAQRWLERGRTPRQPRQPWRPADEPTRRRPCFVAPRRTWGNDHTRLTQRLTSVLTGYFPHVFGWCAALDTPWVCDVRTRGPTLEAVQKTADPPGRRCFQAPHAPHRAINPPRMDGIRQAIPATTDQAVSRASVMLVPTLVEPVGGLTEASGRVEKDIDARTRAPAEVPMLAALPGVGPGQASRFLRALGPERRRDAHVEDWRTFTGMAPLMARSGHTTVTHFRGFGPTCLRHSCHECAGPSIPHAQWAKAVYRQPRLRGKEHQASVRSLAFQWASMIFPWGKKRTPDHERTSVAAGQRRGSPRWQVMAAH
jgi:Transposase IS116/IS110/IS902 family